LGAGAGCGVGVLLDAGLLERTFVSSLGFCGLGAVRVDAIENADLSMLASATAEPNR
jgi:hypothetical protein